MTNQRASLQGALAEHLDLLDHYCITIDEGGSFAFRLPMCVSLRVLFHHTEKSAALLHQMGLQTLPVWSEAREIPMPNKPADLNHLQSSCLLTMMKQSGAGTFVLPRMGRGSMPGHFVPSLTWWTEPIWYINESDKAMSRSDLVKAVAHKDGGAHVDLDNMSAAYIKFLDSGAGWGSGQGANRIGVAASLRQMGYEVLSSPELLKAGGGFRPKSKVKAPEE